MKQYAKGILTGLTMMVMIFMLMASTQAKDDSLSSIMTNLDNYVQDQLGPVSYTHLTLPTKA